MPFSRRTAILLLTSAATFPVAANADVLKSSPRVARTSSSATGRSDPGGIDRLISQLGSDEYFYRRRAEEQLIERGADVFDQLQAAEEHPDLEIASRAHYILQRIKIEWIHPQDSAAVQATMKDYGELTKAERLQRMDRLISLDNDEGLGALCRIARYEPSGQLARSAALVIVRSVVSAERASEQLGVIRQELGDSRRVPVEWLRTYCEQLEQPERVIDRWLTLIDEEAARIADDSPDTKAMLVFQLISFHLELCRENPQPESIFASLQRRTDLYVSQEGQLGIGLAYAMNWLWENEQWEALELLEDHYAETIREERLLIYLAAAARWKQGRNELAEEFAERAYKMETDDTADRETIGDLIGEMGRHDWAEREWWFVVEAFPVKDSNSTPDLRSMSARLSLALLRLHDQGEDRRAVELMSEMIDALEADPKPMSDIRSTRRGRLQLNQLYVQKEYFLACQAAAEGKLDEQRKFLEAACAHNSQDPDVLIAMYRLQDVDKAFRKQTVLRIQQALRTVEGYIEQEPNVAQWHNHWAWLVSNTEGDYAQAVEHSLRSLELSPDSPSYLDTLGRCYYAVGKLEDAVRVQREAVRRHPHLQVMRRQLELFESALAEHQSKSD
jgi:tetratricopeptide (TPR) repeat protein